MKTKKEQSNSMLRHTQTVSGDEQGGNKFYCDWEVQTDFYSSRCKSQCDACSKYP